MKILDSLQVKSAGLEQIGHPREFKDIHEYRVAVGSTWGGRAGQGANMFEIQIVGRVFLFWDVRRGVRLSWSGTKFFYMSFGVL